MSQINAGTKRSILFLLIGEIISALALLSGLNFILNLRYFGFISLLSIIGSIFVLIAVINLRTISHQFERVYYATFGVLACAILSLICDQIYFANGLFALEVIADVFDIIFVGLTIFIGIETMLGCRLLVTGDIKSPFGHKVMRIFLVSIIIAAVAYIVLVPLALITINGQSTTLIVPIRILVGVYLFFYVFAEAFFISLLVITYNNLEVI